MPKGGRVAGLFFLGPLVATRSQLGELSSNQTQLLAPVESEAAFPGETYNGPHGKPFREGPQGPKSTTRWADDRSHYTEISHSFHKEKCMAGIQSNCFFNISPMFRRLVPGLSLAILMLFALTAWAGVGGSISGTVKDASGAVVPNAGAYVSEANYFDRAFQASYWGPNYARLAAVKRKYDPNGLFFVHNGVGSEQWSRDGFSRLTPG